MDDFWRFVGAILHQWIILMSGGVVTVLVNVWERWKKTQVHFAKYIWIMALFIFLASFMAWKDEHIKVLAHAPKAHCWIRQTQIGANNTHGTGITFIMEVHNAGESTGLFDWELLTTLPTGESIKTTAVHNPSTAIMTGTTLTNVLDSSNYLPFVYFSRTLEKGVGVEGWVHFDLLGIPAASLPLGTRFFLSFEDANGNRIMTESTWAAGSIRSM